VGLFDTITCKCPNEGCGADYSEQTKSFACMMQTIREGSTLHFDCHSPAVFTGYIKLVNSTEQSGCPACGRDIYMVVLENSVQRFCDQVEGSAFVGMFRGDLG
jgi:hypothetical protein